MDVSQGNLSLRSFLFFGSHTTLCCRLAQLTAAGSIKETLTRFDQNSQNGKLEHVVSRYADKIEDPI